MTTETYTKSNLESDMTEIGDINDLHLWVNNMSEKLDDDPRCIDESFSTVTGDMSLDDFCGKMVTGYLNAIEDAYEDIDELYEGFRAPSEGFSVRVVACDHRLCPTLTPELHCIVEADNGHMTFRIWLDDDMQAVTFLKDKEVCKTHHAYTFTVEEGREIFKSMEARLALSRL